MWECSGAHSVLLPGKSHGWSSLVGCSPWGREESDTTERLHFHALEKDMATHSSVLAWRIPGMGEPGGLPSMGLHRVRHDWSDLAAAAAVRLSGCYSGQGESYLTSVSTADVKSRIYVIFPPKILEIFFKNISKLPYILRNIGKDGICDTHCLVLKFCLVSNSDYLIFHFVIYH